LTVTDKQTIRKKLDINHKNTHINTIQIKENKQLNTQQKQNYPDSVASYDTQPGHEVGLFYNGPEHHTALLCAARVSVTVYSGVGGLQYNMVSFTHTDLATS